MADNVDITEGSGKTVATDDVGGKQYQRMKLDLGTDGVAAPAVAGAGAVSTGVQRVTLASDDPAVIDLAAIEVLLGTIDADTGAIKTAVEVIDNAISGSEMQVDIVADGAGLATDAKLDTIITALQIMDDWDDSNKCNVNLNIAGTDVSANSGTLDATTLRVTIATDDECNNYLGTIDADTGNIVTAVQLIDDAIYADDADWSDGTSKHMLVGGLYQSTPQTITDGDVGPLEIDANGSLRTVIASGTVTTVSTVTTLSQLGGQAISMGEGVLAAGCQRVTLATDDDGVAHLATIAGDTTNIETAIQIIDDWDAVHDSAASADGPQIMSAYDSTKPTAVGDGDAVRVLADAYGRLLAGVEPQRFQAVFDSADATGEGETVHASAASTIIVVQSYIISSDVEGWIKLQDEASTALTGKFWLKAGGGVAITLPDKAPIILGTDKDLEVICEAAGNVSVSVTGYTIPG